MRQVQESLVPSAGRVIRSTIAGLVTSLAIGTSAAANIEAREPQPANPAAQARHFTTRLGGRVIGLYKSVSRGELSGGITNESTSVLTPEEQQDRQWIGVKLDSGDSQVEGASGKSIMRILVRPEPNGKIHGRDVESVALTEGRTNFYGDYPWGLAFVSLYNNGQGTWNFYGDYATDKSNHRDSVSATTDSRGSDRLTSEKLSAAYIQMDSVIDAALAREPTDFLEPPFRN